MGIVIKVFNSRTNNFASGKKVKLHSSLGFREATTDSSGAAQFPTASSGSYKVYIDGKTVHDGPIVGVQIVQI